MYSAGTSGLGLGQPAGSRSLGIISRGKESKSVLRAGGMRNDIFEVCHKCGWWAKEWRSANNIR